MASHGRVETQQWIRHHDQQASCSSSDSASNESESLMMQLLRDLVFVQVDSVPEGVCQPPQPCLKFVVSHDVDDMLESAEADIKSRDCGRGVPDTCTARTCSVTADVPPPSPFPSKPSHLFLTDSVRSQRPSADDNSQRCQQQPALSTHCQVPSAVTQGDTLPMIDHMPRDTLPVSASVHPQVTAGNNSSSLNCKENVEDVKTLRDDEDDVAVMNGEMVAVTSASEISGNGHVPSNVTSALTDMLPQCSHVSSSSSSVTSSCSDGVSAGKAGSCSSTAVNHGSASSRPRRLSAPASPQRRVTDSTGSSVDRQHHVVRDDDEQQQQQQPECSAGIEKHYSLVRKKRDDGLANKHRCDTTIETASVHPNVIENEQTTCTMTLVGQTLSHDNRSHHVCSLSSPAADVPAPSAAVSGVVVHSARSANRRPDLSTGVVGDHVTGVTSRLAGEWTLNGGADAERRLRRLSRGSLLLARQAPAVTTQSHPPADSELDRFSGTLMACDGQGCVFYVPASDVKVHGDPAGEQWYFPVPVPVTALQATVLLLSKPVEGSFLVYHDWSSQSEYSLAVRRGADVLHYDIVRHAGGDLSIAGHEHSFLTLADLVAYFQHNRSRLVMRLGRPLSTALLPVTAGRDYNARYELARAQVAMTGNIIANGRFGVVCEGEYRHQPVAIKVQLM